LVGFMTSFGGLAFRSAETASAWEYLFFRGLGMFGVSLLLATQVRRSRTPNPISPRLVLAGVVLGAINCLFIAALEWTSVAFVLFAQTVSPLAAAYFSWILLRERASRNVLIATGVSLLGVSVMVAGTIADDLQLASLWTFALPIGFGLYATLIRVVDDPDPTTPPIIAGLVLVVAGVSVTMLSGGFEIAAQDALIGVFAGSVLLGLPIAIFNTAQRAVPASETTMLMMMETVLAPLWVWLLVDERPAPTTVIGGTILLGAILWLSLRRPSHVGGELNSLESAHAH